MSAKKPSVASPIVMGIVLMLTCLLLAGLWNIFLIADTLRLQRLGEVSALRWVVIGLGSAMLLLVFVGLLLFIISSAKQIRENQRQQNFIDSVTHELKSPLTSLKLHLQTLTLRDVGETRRREFLATMLKDVDRLNLLIDHVLEAGRVTAVQKRQQLQVLELGPLLAEATELVQARYQLPTGAIRLQTPPLNVLSDSTSLLLVFTNLLDNAVKYSNDPVAIEVEAWQEGDDVALVRVTDSGMGIPRKQLKRIFRRFHRVGNELTRMRQGTGLGLYIVKETLRQLKGSIRAQSEGVNHGSTFTVTLPLAPAANRVAASLTSVTEHS